MDDLEKEDFRSHLNMDDITDANYARAKRVFKDSEIKNLGEYHNFYVQSNTLLLADVSNSYILIQIFLKFLKL